MLKQLARFSYDDVYQSAWTEVLVTSILRYEDTWASFRRVLLTDRDVDMNEVLSTGFGPVDEAVGTYLFTADRRIVYVEISDLGRDSCVISEWDEDQWVEPDSVADLVAVYLISTPYSREWFNSMVKRCRDKELELREMLGDKYNESALLQTDSYVTFHRGWLLPLVEQHFAEAEARENSAS